MLLFRQSKIPKYTSAGMSAKVHALGYELFVFVMHLRNGDSATG